MIRVIDIETTGMAPGEGAEVIELGWVDVEPSNRIQPITVPGRHWGVALYRPERPCPPEVRAVHHIAPEEYEDSPVFVIGDLRQQLQDHGIEYVAAHNAEYEASFLDLDPSTPWICTYKVALRVWPDAPSHGNQALMYWLGLEQVMIDELRHPPHRALPDAYVTAHILQYLMTKRTIEEMVAISLEPRLLPTCPIGKFRGKKWADVEWGFLSWMLKQGDMEADLKWNAQREIDRRRTEHLRGDA